MSERVGNSQSATSTQVKTRSVETPTRECADSPAHPSLAETSVHRGIDHRPVVAHQPASKARVVSKGQMNKADGLAFSAREPRRLARRTRRRQGLPETVTDPRVIARIVLLMTSGGRHVGDATPDGPGSARPASPTRPQANKGQAGRTASTFVEAPSPVFTPPMREGKPTFDNAPRA